MISQEEEFANMVQDATSAVDKLSSAVEQLAAGFAPLGEFFNSAAGTFTMFAGGTIAAGVAIAQVLKGIKAA